MKLVHSYQYGYGGIGDMLRSMFGYFVYSKIHNIDYYLDFSKTDLKYCFDNKFDFEEANEQNKNILSFTQIGSKSDAKTKEYLQFILDSKNNPDIVIVIYSNIFDFVSFDDLKTHRTEFLDFLKLSETVRNRIDELLKNSGLKEKEFNSVHVRCGDHFMSTINIDCDSRINPNDSVNIIKSIVEKNNTDGFKTLLFTDNEPLKNYHKNLGAKTLDINIIHSAIGPLSSAKEDLEKNKKNTIDTVAEFFIIASSNSVIAIKDSGFSFWSTFLYGTPLYRINNDKITLITHNSFYY